MTIEAHTERAHKTLFFCIPRRLRIVSLGVVLLILSSVGLCLLTALKILNFTPEGVKLWLSMLPELIKLWLLMLAGPFAGLMVLPDTSPWAAMGAINLLVILAHPIWPSRITAVVTLLAFASWLFWGVAVAFSGV